MPKDHRKRVGEHETSVKLAGRDLNTGKYIEDKAGTTVGTSNMELLARTVEVHPMLTKKEKHQAKRDAFLQRLDISTSASSKSHTRRMKRKAKEQLANGLSELQIALAELVGDVPLSTRKPAKDRLDASQEYRTKIIEPGIIGEGRRAPLSDSQRKCALQFEQVRHPLVLAHPDFTANPFQTIRTHAQNTLLQHVPDQK